MYDDDEECYEMIVVYCKDNQSFAYVKANFFADDNCCLDVWEGDDHVATFAKGHWERVEVPRA